MTLALDLLQHSLAAAEPGSQYPKLLVGAGGTVRVIAVPNEIHRMADLLHNVSKKYNTGSEFNRVCRIDDRTYFVADDYSTLAPYFSGDRVHFIGDVQAGKVAYVPKVGHILDNNRHYKDIAARPNAVVYTGYVYILVETARFGETLTWMVKENAVPGIYGLDYEWLGDKFALIMRVVEGKPMITAKQVPALEARIEALKRDLRERADTLIACCNRFREFEAVKAFKLEPLK